MYIATWFRLDLAIVTIMSASSLHKLKLFHITATRLALRYLIERKDKNMLLKRGDNEQLTVVVDASLGNAFKKESSSCLEYPV